MNNKIVQNLGDNFNPNKKPNGHYDRNGLPDIKWILFDQAGVQTQSLFSTQKNYSVNNKIISASKMKQIFDTEEYNLFAVGELSENDMIEYFIEQNSLPISKNDYIQILKKSIKTVPGIEPVLAQLSNNYKLAALIEEGKEWAEYKLEASGFSKYFNGIITSADLGVKKTDYRFFEETLKILNTDALECLFIDDKPINCNAAEFCGIASIIFDNPQQLVKELKDNYGIIIK